MSLYCEEKGSKEGTPIVFIHGGGISGWMWKKQLEHFADYHCIVPDLPEHGKSINEKPLSISDSAKRIAELIKQKTKEGKAHVVGHSLGGKVIIELLSTNPEVVDHAVVASALFRPVPMGKLLFNKVTYKTTVAMLKNKRMLDWQAGQFNFPDAYYTENFINESKALTVEMLERIYGELYKHLAIPETLKNAAAPTLIVAGEMELKAMKQSMHDLLHVMPNAKGALVRNVAHQYPWSMHNTFSQLIRGWIENQEILKAQGIVSLVEPK